MKKEKIARRLGRDTLDAGCYYLLMAAGVICLCVSFPLSSKVVYESILCIVCMLFLGSLQGGRCCPENKKVFLLPGAMVLWFLIIQFRRDFQGTDINGIGWFVCAYLFAFPLASLLQDGEGKNVLKLFAGAYTVAAAALSLAGVILFFDCVPEIFADQVYWNGGRLSVFWHPNILGCYLMIGIILGTTYWMHAKSLRVRVALMILLAVMMIMLALTNCRTTIILTGGYLGLVLFFTMLRKGRKWFVPGVLAAIVFTVIFYGSASRLYQANYDLLVKRYAQQHTEQTAPAISDAVTEETDSASEQETIAEAEEQSGVTTDNEIQEENDRVKADPDTGEVKLITDSPQGTLSRDIGTLNSRTRIWNSALFAIRETPSILYWGMFDPGWYVSFYSTFPIAHMHNSWLECLVGMGLVGFLLSVIFTLIAIWNCVVILVAHHRELWKRNIALLVLCLLMAAFLEPYLFYTRNSYYPINFLFFLCSGYLVHWQEKDNRHFFDLIRNRIFLHKSRI